MPMQVNFIQEVDKKKTGGLILLININVLLKLIKSICKLNNFKHIVNYVNLHKC